MDARRTARCRFALRPRQSRAGGHRAPMTDPVRAASVSRKQAPWQGRREVAHGDWCARKEEAARRYPITQVGVVIGPTRSAGPMVSAEEEAARRYPFTRAPVVIAPARSGARARGDAAGHMHGHDRQRSCQSSARANARRAHCAVQVCAPTAAVSRWSAKPQRASRRRRVLGGPSQRACA